jgi:hypothetical protein
MAAARDKVTIVHSGRIIVLVKYGTDVPCRPRRAAQAHGATHLTARDARPWPRRLAAAAVTP